MNSSHCTTNCWGHSWLADGRKDKLMNANRQNKENVFLRLSDSLDLLLGWKNIKVTVKAFQTLSWPRELNKLINSETSTWNSDDFLLNMSMIQISMKSMQVNYFQRVKIPKCFERYYKILFLFFNKKPTALNITLCFIRNKLLYMQYCDELQIKY